MAKQSNEQIRTAIRRMFAARAAQDEANAAHLDAAKRLDTAKLEATAAVRDLGSLTGAGAFAIDGRLVRVEMPNVIPGGMGTSGVGPTVTVSPLTDVMVVDEPVVMPAAASEPVAKPASAAPALKAGAVPASVPVREKK